MKMPTPLFMLFMIPLWKLDQTYQFDWMAYSECICLPPPGNANDAQITMVKVTSYHANKLTYNPALLESGGGAHLF